MCIPNVYIPEVFNECTTVEMQIMYLANKVADLEERVEALEGSDEAEEASE